MHNLAFNPKPASSFSWAARVQHIGTDICDVTAYIWTRIVFIENMYRFIKYFVDVVYFIFIFVSPSIGNMTVNQLIRSKRPRRGCSPSSLNN